MKRWTEKRREERMTPGCWSMPLLILHRSCCRPPVFFYCCFVVANDGEEKVGRDGAVEEADGREEEGRRRRERGRKRRSPEKNGEKERGGWRLPRKGKEKN